MRRALAGLASLFLGLSLVGSARAAGGPVEREIQGLFWGITAFTILVAVIVYGAMFWFIIRYRRGVAPVPTSQLEGSRKLEIAWTVFPTIIVVLITLMSIPVLRYTDTAPIADTTIVVTGQQFYWNFTYEDGSSTIGEMWIQEDVVVHLHITSLDVIHSFAVPDLGIKIDAVPGEDHVNVWWLKADTPGDYLNQCAEFCGIGHYGMRATIHVFEAGSQPRIFGPPPQPLQVTDVEMREDGGNATAPWSITPRNLTAPVGAIVRLRIWNNGSASRDFRIDAPVNESAPMIMPYSNAWLNFTIGINATSPSPVPYGPADPGARAQGMIGHLTIESGRVIRIIFRESGCPPPKTFCLLTDPPQNPIRIAKGEAIMFELRNEGNVGHNFRMDEPFGYFYSKIIPAGESDFFGPLPFNTDARGKYWCDITGHRALGMEADFIVGDPPQEEAGGVPTFEMMSITLAVGVPATFGYLIHHARRRDEA